MKAWTSLFVLTLGFVSVGVAACSGGDTTATTTTSTGDTASASASAGGTGGGATSGTGGAASTGTGTGGAGGGSSSASSATSSGAGGVAAFSLMSTGFSEGMVIPDKYACNNGPGSDGSPDLSWTAGPAGTLSYAVVLTDKSFNNSLHWVIWDIPGGTTALPASVEKVANPSAPAGSKQVKSFDNQTFGYRGPCPPETHTYEFAVFALDVATLPNLTTAATLAQAKKQILLHDLGSATLTGTYTP